MLINKIKKYLLRYKEIEVYKKNESGSEYFKIGNSKIRVSDHLATSLSDPTTLNIVINNDQFVIFYGNKLININNYNEFKNFLKYHILMCNFLKGFIKKEIKKKSESKKKIKSEQILDYKGEKFDISDLTSNQIKNLHKNLNTYPKRESVIKVINDYRKQNK